MTVPVLEVRGEVFMPRAAFERLNREREAAGRRPSPTRATPPLDRSSSLTRGLWPGARWISCSMASAKWRIPAARRLCRRPRPNCSPGCAAGLQDPGAPLGLPLRGGTGGGHCRVGSGPPRLRLRDRWAVVKLNRMALRERVGATAKAPRWAIAYKYAPEQAETKLKAITIQVGRTGVLTPVAELEPVFLAGSTISRATLHNEEEIRRKDIRVGDTVVIEKAGEVIPAVVQVVPDKRPTTTKPFNLLEHIGGKCPACGGPVAKEKVSAGDKEESLGAVRISPGVRHRKPAVSNTSPSAERSTSSRSAGSWPRGWSSRVWPANRSTSSTCQKRNSPR